RQYSIIRLVIWICECITVGLAIRGITSFDQIKGPLYIIIPTGLVSGVGILATLYPPICPRGILIRDTTERRYSPTYVVFAQALLDFCTLTNTIAASFHWQSDPRFDELAIL